MIEIKDIRGNLRFRTSINEGSVYKKTLMKEDYILLKFSVDHPVPFEKGDYCETEFGRFEIVDLVFPAENKTTGGYDYELRMDATYYKWKNKILFYDRQGQKEASWVLTSTPEEHLSIVLSNLDSLGYTHNNTPYSCEGMIDPDIAGISKVVQYSSTNIIDALTKIAEAWECEWWITDHHIHLGKCEDASDVTLTIDKEINQFSRSESKDNYATRIYPFGSTRNIPDYYGKKLKFICDEVERFLNFGEWMYLFRDSTRPLKREYFLDNKEEYTESFIINEDIEIKNLAPFYSFVLLNPISCNYINLEDFYIRAYSNEESVRDFAMEICLCRNEIEFYHSGFKKVEIPIDGYADIKFDNIHVTGPDSFSIRIKTWYRDVRAYLKGNVSISVKGDEIGYRKFRIKKNDHENDLDCYLVKREDGYWFGDKNIPIESRDIITCMSGFRYDKLPLSYFTSDKGDTNPVVEGVVEKRLRLPAGMDYVDIFEGEEVSQEKIVESVVLFDDVYPRKEGNVSNVRCTVEDEKDQNGNSTNRKFYHYTFKDSGLKNFSDSYLIKGKEDEGLKCIFQTGSLAGYEFNLTVKETGNDGTTFEIAVKDENGHLMPNEFQKPSSDSEGDKKPDTYILHGYDTQYVYDGLIGEAEEELLQKAEAYLEKSKVDPSVFTCTMNPVRSAGYILNEAGELVHNAADELDFDLGHRVSLAHPGYFKNGKRTSRVIGFEKKLDNKFEAIYTIGESTQYSRIGELENKLKELTFRGNVYTNTGGGSSVYVVGNYDSTAPTDRNVFSSQRTVREIKERALSRREDDVATGHISFENGMDVTKGISTDTLISTEMTTQQLSVLDNLQADKATFSGEVSSASYAEKMLGWKVEADGGIDAKSLKLREFLEVPELRYNHISLITGEQWCAAGGGIVESVEEDEQKISLKLEPGELAAIAVNDLCKGIFNNETGFQTAYFKITEKLTDTTFKYVLREGYAFHPRKAMHFVAYGNTDDVQRQKSAFSTQSYTRYLAGVNDWEITDDRIVMQFGDLSGFTLDGTAMAGYSAYLKNIYLTGTIKQLSTDGQTESVVPCFKGEWQSGTAYYFHDQVTHNGSVWLCVSDVPTNLEPTASAAEWLETSTKGEDAVVVNIVSSNGIIFQLGSVSTTLTAQVMRGSRDITRSIPKNAFSWERLSGDLNADGTFNEAHTGYGNELALTSADVNSHATFNCIVSV